MNKFKKVCKSIFFWVKDLITLIFSVVIAIVSQPALVVYVIIKSIVTKTSVTDAYHSHTNVVLMWMSGLEEDE